MKLNQKPIQRHTHEGAVAKHINPEQQLRRTVLSCMLWEREFYESGQSIADRITECAKRVPPEVVADLAVRARTEYKLRHAPLLLLLALLPAGGKLVERTIEATINRPDELSELLAMYWRRGKRPIPPCMKRGLAAAMLKFDEYQYAKWDRPAAIRLRDVMRLVHPKPRDDEQSAMFRRLKEAALTRPDTWESRMAAGADKCEVFTDLLKRKKLGYMALLRNLRGMLEAGVDRELIKTAIGRVGPSVLPFRFIAAARHAPQFEPQLDAAMIKLLDSHTPLPGATTLLVDVSGSMSHLLSSKSDLTRMDAAAALGVLLSGICDSLRVFTFSEHLIEVPPRKGMALRDAIVNSQRHWCTNMGQAVTWMNQNMPSDTRLIVITDEQTRDRVPDPTMHRAYMINVASATNGIGYGKWRHVDGFSEAVVDFIQYYEAEFDESTVN